MKKRLLYILLTAGLVAAAALAAFTIPASAEQRADHVRLVTGEVVTITVDVPPGTPLSEIEVPGVIVNEPAAAHRAGPPGRPQPTPRAGAADRRRRASRRRRPTSASRGARAPAAAAAFDTQPLDEGVDERASARSATRSATPTARPPAPTPASSTRCPARSTATGVPNFVIRKFRVPIFLLPIYQAAGIQYGIRWEILAAINEIETDYGRNLNVSSAGALGWMQFIPSSWKAYGVDANKDGVKDPYNPVDAIFAAARYLERRRLRGGRAPRDLRLQPRRLVRRLGDAPRPPDRRRARRPGRLADRPDRGPLPRLRARALRGRPGRAARRCAGSSAARTPPTWSSPSRQPPRDRDLLAQGAPVVAVNDGVVKKIGRSKALGRYLVLQDVYGNRYTYAHLGEVSKHLPGAGRGRDRPAPLGAGAVGQRHARPPRPGPPRPAARSRTRTRQGGKRAAPPTAPQASVPDQGAPVRPSGPAPTRARPAGSSSSSTPRPAREGGFDDLQELLLAPVRPRRQRTSACKQLKAGLARDRRHDPRPDRPDRAGQGRPPLLLDPPRRPGRAADRPEADPRRLEAARGHRDLPRQGHERALRHRRRRRLLDRPDPAAAEAAARAPRALRPADRDLRVRRARTSAAARSTAACSPRSPTWPSRGCKPTVTSLKCGHGFYTASGNVSHHSSGNAVDIAKINGVPILGHQEPGGITEQTVRQLMRLQGTMRPDQIISLLEIGGPTFAMADHADHIHVGFQAAVRRRTRKLGRQALAVLKPGQWSDLLARLREIENPVVPTKPSKYSLPAENADKRASDAHTGRIAAPPALFGFVQLEFGFLLGPADGRYLLRRSPDAEPERVLVLRHARARRSGACSRAAAAGSVEEAEAEPVPTSRATVVRAQPFESPGEAEAWLDGPARRRRAGRGRGRRGRARPQRRDQRAPRRGRRPPRPRRLRRPGAGGPRRLRRRRGGGRRALQRRLGAAARATSGRAARWRRRRSASRRCSAAASSRWPARSWCCAPGRTSTPAARARPRCRRASRSRRCWPSCPPRELEADREAIGEAANAALRGDPSPELQEAVAACIARMEAVLAPDAARALRVHRPSTSGRGGRANLRPTVGRSATGGEGTWRT